MRPTRVLRLAWAAPASAIGLVLALPVLALGGQARRHRGVIEVSGPGNAATPGQALVARLPFTAITFGHVVIAATAADQRRLRAHERVHVAQYERLGPLFLLAYPAESLLQALRGRRPYWDNRFEVEARRRAHGAAVS